MSYCTVRRSCYLHSSWECKILRQKYANMPLTRTSWADEEEKHSENMKVDREAQRLAREESVPFKQARKTSYARAPPPVPPTVSSNAFAGLTAPGSPRSVIDELLSLPTPPELVRVTHVEELPYAHPDEQASPAVHCPGAEQPPLTLCHSQAASQPPAPGPEAAPTKKKSAPRSRSKKSASAPSEPGTQES